MARAVDQSLGEEFECTVWCDGVFNLSNQTLDDLKRISEMKDFGIFVFSPDAVTNKREELFRAPRDNVIFEFGLFIGKLGLDRTFFLVPKSSKIHLPSDLNGLTYGDYEDQRSDKNWIAAVSAFCEKVRESAAQKGL